METEVLLNSFYSHFAKGEAAEMLKHYGNDVTFYDPAFGKLTQKQPHNMWRMLLSRFDANTSITYQIIETTATTGKVKWTANYYYGPQKRRVTNHVTSTLTLQNGKIISHYDDFDIWKWASQALGLTGALFGWTPFLKKKIQQTTNKALAKYIARHEN